MWIKNRIKSMIFKLPRCWIDSLYRVYNILRYPEMRTVKKCYGVLNPQKTIYVIRPRTDCVEGLMSLFMNVLRQLSYAEKKGYIPVIDLENYATQYLDENMIPKNVWDYYFTQPSDISLQEAYKSRSVILAGINDGSLCYPFLKKDFSPTSIQKANRFFRRYFSFSEEVMKKVDQEEKDIQPWNAIGVYLRGTDYVVLKPAGEAIQPTPDQVFDAVDPIMKEYKDANIFLVTEDLENYRLAKERYGDKIKTVSFDTYISNYSGISFLSHDPSLNELSDSPYIRGLYYLVKLVILSHCRYIIGGNTCGSWAACVFADDHVEKLIFDLGTY